MAVRYTFQFITKYNETYRVDVEDDDYAGDPIEIEAGPDGFTLKHDGETDSVNPGIMGSSCSVSMLVTPETTAEIDDFALDLINSGEDRFLIAVYEITAGPTTSLFWVGYVIKDVGRFEDIGISYFFTIKAADGIARLKSTLYKDASATPDAPYGMTPFFDHLYTCLTNASPQSYWTGSDVFLRTVVNWRESGHPALAAAVDPLAYSRVSGHVFAKKRNNTVDEDWEFFSMYKVLEEICRHWNARLMLSRGCWRFEQVRERMEENFYERRYDIAGALLSSTNAAGYDKVISQTSNENRLSGGEFSYLPALTRAEVNYKHGTYVNQVENQNYRWQKDSAFTTLTYSVSGISFDADTHFKVSGVLTLDVEVTYTKPWRAVFGIILRLPDTPYRLKSMTTIKQLIPTAPVYDIQRGPVEWVTPESGVFYEISTDIITSSKYKGQVPFSFVSPYIPSGEDGFSVNFAGQIRGELVDLNPVTLTFTDWKFSSLVLTLNGLDVASNYETDRIYTAENSVLGNSDKLTIDSIFGHAIKPWTPTRIEVSNNLTDWTPAGSTWDRGAETDDVEFGQLLANQIQALQLQPPQTYSGKFKSAGLQAHRRFVLPDDSTWLVNRCEFMAKGNELSVEIIKTGVADGADIDYDTPIGLPIDDIPGVITSEIVVAPSDGLGTTTAQGDPGRLALAMLTSNTLSSGVATGTITSIPVDHPVKGGVLNDGDIIVIYDPQSGTLTPFEVDGDQAAGNTSIAVVSQVTDIDIPLGAQVFYPDLNYFTQSTGDAPAGTVDGSGAAGQVATWLSATELTGENNLWWDATNNRLGVGTNAPSQSIDIRGGRLKLELLANNGAIVFANGTSSDTNTRIDADASGNIFFRTYGTTVGFRTYDTNAAALVFQLNNNGQALAPSAGGWYISDANTGSDASQSSSMTFKDFGGNFYFRRTSSGVNQMRLSAGLLRIGDATAPVARLDIAGQGTTSSTYGIKVFDGAGTPAVILYVRDDKRVGINVDPADAVTQIKGAGTTTGKALLVEASDGTDNFIVQDSGLITGQALQNNTTAPTLSYGAGAGTGPTTDLITGGQNGFNIYFTTGTTPSASTTVFTINLNKSFANGCAPSAPCALNAATQAIINGFWVSGTANNSITVAYAGTLAASTSYAFSMVVMGF